MRSVDQVGGMGGSLARDATVLELAKPLFAVLRQHPGATELVVNRPGWAHIEVGADWVNEPSEALNYAWANSFARAVATYTDQNIGAVSPILSAMLPGGERIQIVLPPAVEPGSISLTMRIPGSQVKPLDSYAADGFFDHYRWAFDPAAYQARSAELASVDRTLVDRLQARDLGGFLRDAVRVRKNIAVVGDTGSGKTTLMKSLCQEIPDHERLVTIEDVRELFLPKHGNRVHLLYSKGGQGVAELTPAQLIASTMRMKPDRVLLAELRGSEAFDFLKLLTTGHNGSITSYHAESCALAVDRYVFMSLEHADARVFDVGQLKRLVALTIDVIVHVVAENMLIDGRWIKRRFLRQVQFDPMAKLDHEIGAAHLVGYGDRR